MTEKKDFLIDAARGHLLANKNKEYRERIRLYFRVFVDFLQNNNLTTRQLLAEGEEVTEELKIYKSDLTEEGFAVVAKSLDKWSDGIDRGKDVTDISLLEKTLAAVKASNCK